MSSEPKSISTKTGFVCTTNLRSSQTGAKNSSSRKFVSSKAAMKISSKKVNNLEKAIGVEAGATRKNRKHLSVRPRGARHR